MNQIQITTKGASGGEGGDFSSGIPGFGVSIQGNFSVEPGQVLKILVGEEGEGAAYVGGGGGGTFVWESDTDQLLSAAGGGGGGGFTDGAATYVDGIDAAVGEDGNHGNGFDNGAGTDGEGGVAPTPTAENWHQVEQVGFQMERMVQFMTVIITLLVEKHHYQVELVILK